ncbi:DUF2497 domain-containing protein [Erythrobacteraceae bacterium CFH 75059]|uniref:DUF2497 domain-containing protein n=1 Tax=Qipengyuania thermophila TaxID=2509361 RepID=UPI001021F993|nr:DUF2497 domain-containing protein [Qipengyuania thermophila]TCD06678.1 DUF2497 domain-containing protein [Erythrobacteraceae bacterium CFH 75059]
MHQPGEPSVEVILDSIKRVIARENRALERRRGDPVGGADWHPDRSPAAVEVEPASADEAAEVLDLEEDEIVTVPDWAPQDSEAAAMLDEEDLAPAEDWPAAEAAGATAAEDDAGSPARTGSGEEEDKPLMSGAARTALRDNFAALQLLSTLARERAGDGGDMESMVQALLRPMLARWLDEHLPPLVERLVRDEIRRIVGQG